MRIPVRHSSPAPPPAPSSPSGSGAKGLLVANAVLALGAICAVTSPACSGGGSGSRTGSTDTDLAGIVLVSIDTLRADHLACYGHPDARTPHIDELAARGTRFESCTSSCPLTLPSHTTLMTGTYPYVHGARNNATFVVHEDNETLAETLQRAGWATHAEVGTHVLDARFGLDQGFDGYNAGTSEGSGSDPEVLTRTAGAVTDAALAWLAGRPRDGRPFFLFAHYYDPHRPFDAPEPYASDFADGYLAEIAYTDNEVGRLLTALRTPELEGRVLVALTSDHGEGLGEHGESAHGYFLYDSTLRVPLIVAGPGLAGGQVVAAEVGLVDVTPTLLELADVGSAAAMQGTSLVPLLEDPERDLGLSIYAETVVPLALFGYAPLRAWRHAGWKYLHAPRPELYATREDPREADDRAAEAPDRTAAMRAELLESIRQAPRLLGRGSAGDLDSEETRRLMALGYLSADGPVVVDDPRFWVDELTHFEPTGTNPMDHGDDFELVHHAIDALREADHAAGIEAWSELTRRFPTYARGYKSLARCYASLGRFAEAIPPLERALELEPDSCEELHMLGSMLARTGRYAKARGSYERTLECDPDHARARLDLATVLLRSDAAGEAAEVLRPAVEREPGDARAHALLAEAHSALGRHGDAAESLAQAIDRSPDDPQLHLAHARELERAGRSKAAGERLAEALRRFPRHAPLRAAAARHWFELGAATRALETLDAEPPALGTPAQSGAQERHGRSPALSALRIRLLSTAREDTVRDGARALALAERLLAEHPEDPRVLGAAAAASAEAGDFERAVRLAESALGLAEGDGAQALAARLREELDGYRSGRPLRVP